MPRKKQIVQTKKRQKVYRAGEFSGDAANIKPKGAFKIFGNYTLFAVIGAIVLISGLVISAVFGGNGSSSTTNPNGVRGEGVTRQTPQAGETATNSDTGAATNIKQYSTAPDPAAAGAIDPAKTYTAIIKTEQGDVTVELDAKQAPVTVNNFVFLAKDGFYDGSTFYRVIADASGTLHFAQAGDPTGTGSGGPGYDLPVENINGTAFSDEAGVLAMAKPQEAGSLNNGSQFFFTLQKEPTLDGKFTVFGKVTNGLDVLAKLQPRDPQTEQDPPPGARIESITITES
jgi:peptidyl-prolyl cis-trans isomerase B (cyclophilin B)